HAQPLGRAQTDVAKVRQVLVSLLHNASRFTNDGTIVLTGEREADWITVRVRDTGIGLKDEQISRLFPPFMQVDSSATRKHGGTGMGLAITKRLCEMMEGSISVESALGAGSTFTVRLPARIEGARGA